MMPPEIRPDTGFSTRLRELRVKRGLRQKDLAAALGLAQTTIANYEKDIRFPDESTLLRIADFFNTSLDYLMGRAEVPWGTRPGGAPSPQASVRQPLTELCQEYLRVLCSGEREAAFALVRRALSGGTTIRELYATVLEPALWEVGRLWSAGEMSVAGEHFFAESTQTLISQLQPALRAGSRPKRGRRFVCFGVCGELHVIGVRMVADLLEMDGWDSFFLGGNLCTQHALQAITRWPPDLLGLSVTIPYYVASARELVLAVRSERSLAAVKILVGGQALNAAPGIWKDLGADGWARNLEECVDAANGLVGEKQ